jgi:glucose/arabinose dehydrogenase
MQRIVKLAVLAAVSTSIVATARTPTIAATAHRAVVKVVAVKTGLNGPSAFTFAPGGTIWYLERGTGEVHTLNPSTGGDHRVFTIPGVDGSGERGALGIALHPNWPATRRVFVYVTRSHAGHLQNQLVRFSVSGGSGSNLRILLAAPASASPYHNGGRILFGPDHKLYVVIGDGHNSANAQDRKSNLRGKILRLDTDGTAAHGNPIGRIWSFGHRNSFGFAFDPRTKRLWETDNGPTCTSSSRAATSGGARTKPVRRRSPGEPTTPARSHVTCRRPTSRHRSGSRGRPSANAVAWAGPGTAISSSAM